MITGRPGDKDGFVENESCPCWPQGVWLHALAVKPAAGPKGATFFRVRSCCPTRREKQGEKQGKPGHKQGEREQGKTSWEQGEREQGKLPGFGLATRDHSANCELQKARHSS